MIGLVIVTWGDLADALLRAAEQIVGTIPESVTVSIASHDDIDGKREEIARAVSAMDTGEGVLIVTDLFGGTSDQLNGEQASGSCRSRLNDRPSAAKLVVSWSNFADR